MFSCVEAERMAHLVADLRAAQAGDRDQLRAVAAAGHKVEKVGVVGEKNPARLIGVRDEVDVGGQFPFAQAVEIGVGFRGGERLVNSYGTMPFVQGTVAGEMPA